MLKVILRILLLLSGFLILTGEKGCDGREINTTALDEQSATEVNQQLKDRIRDLKHLLTTQPPPRIDWSLERDNLIKRSKLQNDRSINFYMYVFIEGIDHPIGYYLVNKVSSVDSQLTNTMQIVSNGSGGHVLPSPAEDGSYGTNGNSVFGFTPDDAYIEHNMKYIVSTIPLTFFKEVPELAIVNSELAKDLLQKSKEVINKK